MVNKLEPGAADPNAPDAGEGGDSFADYGKGFTAAESVDGVGDSWSGSMSWDDPRTGKVGPLKGNFNQLKKLKAKHPHLKAYISLGGWTWSKWFGKAASTDALRRQLVASCIDLYIKGNLPFDSSANAGGEGTAAGVFDGIDIDWEFPGGGGQPYNVVEPNDKANYTLLLQEFRRQLDAYGAQTGKHYGLTVAIGSGGDKIANTDPAEYSKPLDWINIMSYDFHGGWEPSGPTDFQSNLYLNPDSPNAKTENSRTYNVDAAVKTLLARGVPPSKIVVGIPFYGRGWTGVPPGPNGDGLYQSAAKPALGTYEAGIEDYKVLKSRPGTVREHPVTKQSWKYDGTNFWSYDTPTTVRAKVDYARQNNLRGVFGWELDGDTADGELINVMGEMRK
jgi:chitinase